MSPQALISGCQRQDSGVHRRFPTLPEAGGLRGWCARGSGGAPFGVDILPERRHAEVRCLPKKPVTA